MSSLCQLWSNLRLIVPIYDFLRYVVLKELRSYSIGPNLIALGIDSSQVVTDPDYLAVKVCTKRV